MVENIVLKNLVTSAVLELDKVTTPNYVLDSVDWGQIESNHHSFKYVNQIGVYVTGTTLETRDIEVIGWIVAQNENAMTNRKRMLNQFVNPQQRMSLTYQEYVLEFLPDRTIQYSAAAKENNEVVCKFKISGIAADPLFKKAVKSTVSAATTIGLFHFPLIINSKDQDPPQIVFGLRQPALIVDVYNAGAVSTGMQIIFRATGTMSGPKLINVQTQEFFRINKTLVAGEEIIVDTVIGEKSIIGRNSGNASNYFKYRDIDSTWLQLNVGDNLFRYDADSNLENLEVYINYDNKYLEVQECY